MTRGRPTPRSSRIATSIRRAQASDASAIAALVGAAYAHYPERIGARPAPMDADYGQAIAEHEVWVTPTDGDLRGVLVLRTGSDHLFVDNVAVAPDAQGAGVGRLLLEHAESRARDLGRPELRLLTHELMAENRALYEHLGWESTRPPADERHARVYFRKHVSGDHP